MCQCFQKIVPIFSVAHVEHWHKEAPPDSKRAVLKVDSVPISPSKVAQTGTEHADSEWHFQHQNGTKLFGPAGAGKTRTLVNWLQEHEADGDFRLGEGIICSFTRAAAHDISRRVNTDHEPGPYHTTLHSLAKRYLGIDSPVAEPRLGEFFKTHAIEYDRSTHADPDMWQDTGSLPGNLLNAFWTRCRNQLWSFEEGWQLEPQGQGVKALWSRPQAEKLFESYSSWKMAEGLVDFTDMLEFAVESPPAGIQWPVFVMDECQDSTRLQWMVAQAFADASECVYLGGDDDQAIYSWAGAHPEDFLRADCGRGSVEILRTNHRSGAALVENAQAFIRRNRRRVDKAMVASRAGGVVKNASVLPKLALSESTFLMARAHYLMTEWMEELERRGYPFVDLRGKFGVTGKASSAFRRFLALATGGRISLSEWRLLANDAIPSQGPWLVRGAKQRLKELDRDFVEQHGVALDDLGAYGATEELVNAIRVNATAPLGRLDQRRLSYLQRVADAHGAEFVDAQRAGAICRVGPVHQFKGLECDHVVLHSGTSKAATLDAIVDPEAERRVFYVAMTRPKERLTIVKARAFAQFEDVLR